MRGLLVGLVALPLAAAAPEAPPPAWQGVWQGTIGTLPVRACLMRRAPDVATGTYYYLWRLRPIPFVQQGTGRVWLEDPVAGGSKPRARWTFEVVGAETLTGNWSDGGRRLPFRLTRLGGRDEGCDGDAFNAPRRRPLGTVATPARIDGGSYLRLRFDPGPAFTGAVLESFALSGRDPATRRINARLRRQMPADPAEGAWYGCLTGMLAAQGVEGDYDVTVRPTLITPRWLAASEAIGGNCGGAHQFAGATSLTFDRRTGVEVDLHRWLNAAAAGRLYDTSTVRPALRRAILAREAGSDPECREAAAATDYWDIGLARAGLVFTPGMPHAMAACENPVTMPWAALRPWLAAEGRAAAAEIGARR